MFPLRPPAIGFQKQRGGRESVAMLIGKYGAEFEQKRETLRIQSFTRPHNQSWNDAGAHGVQAPSGFKLALEARPVKSVLQIFGTHLAQHRDDRILPYVCGVRHWRTPVAVGDATCAFVKQTRILQ